MDKKYLVKNFIYYFFDINFGPNFFFSFYFAETEQCICFSFFFNWKQKIFSYSRARSRGRAGVRERSDRLAKY